jgi:hypothetical protein
MTVATKRQPLVLGRAVAQAVSRRLSSAAARVRALVRSCEVCGEQSGTEAGTFTEYFGFPCQFAFHRLLHIHHHLSSWAGAIGQTLPAVKSGPSLTPSEKKNTPSGSNMSVI